MKPTLKDQYATLPDESKESASSRPAVDPPMPWLTMTPEREAALIANGFARNRYPFALRGKACVEPGRGWVRRDARGLHTYTDTMALSELKRLEDLGE
jgi:hypothetical protein